MLHWGGLIWRGVSDGGSLNFRAQPGEGVRRGRAEVVDELLPTEASQFPLPEVFSLWLDDFETKFLPENKFCWKKKIKKKAILPGEKIIKVEEVKNKSDLGRKIRRGLEETRQKRCDSDSEKNWMGDGWVDLKGNLYGRRRSLFFNSHFLTLPKRNEDEDKATEKKKKKNKNGKRKGESDDPSAPRVRISTCQQSACPS